jgi:phosphomethylpyrimidine synthase
VTELEQARSGRITDAIRAAAQAEGVEPELIRAGVAAGEIIVCHNRARRNGRPLAVGRGLRTKVNANLGTSADDLDVEKELAKARVAVESGADALMDLSTGGPVDEIRRAVLAETQACVGSVPVYQAALDAVREQRKAIVDMTVDDLFRAILRHAEDGVDFITVHCGVTRATLARMRREGRIMDVVSRGGAFLIEWMIHNERENPLYEQFPRLLEIARGFDLVLSLGDGFRPGCLADATDRAQVHELILLGELTQQAQAAGVQVMVEGPGHVPLTQIQANITLQKRLCHGAPFYVLGPLVTDIAPGYDHIVCAIGGAIAAAAGADFLCYVTPAEHLRLPTLEDVREGVMAARIAAHAADIAKGVKGAFDRDVEMARHRKRRDWEGQFAVSLDPAKARRLRAESGVADHGACTMCGEFCAYKVMDEALGECA